MCIRRKRYAVWTAKEKKTQAWDFKRKKKKKKKEEKNLKTFCICTSVVIIKTIDAENESVHFLKKLNMVTYPPTYV